MPLKTVDTDKYIKRTRVLIDSTDRERDTAKNDFDYKYRIDDEIQNVISVEAVGWNFDSLLSPVWAGSYATSAPTSSTDQLKIHNNTVAHTYDLLIEDEVLPVGDSLLITVDMEKLGGLSHSFAWRNELNSMVDVAVLFGMVAAFTFISQTISTDPISYANTQLFVTESDKFQFQFASYRSSGLLAMPSYFLFKTGPTASTNGARALGFKDDEDTTLLPLELINRTIGQGLDHPLKGTYLVDLQPYKYIDISVRELHQDFNVLNRVYLNRIFDRPVYVRPYNDRPKARLLSNPLRNLKFLTIQLTLMNNTRLPPQGTGSHQIEFEILSIAQVHKLPSWIQQRLEF